MTTLWAVLTIIAIMAGPVLAVQTQKLIERITQKHLAKKGLFMTLMSTRDRRLLPEHVQALNMIDIIFSGKSKKDNAVVEAWSEYRDHLYSYPKEPESDSGKELSEAQATAYKTQCDAWHSKVTDLLVELLAKMAASLNYHFDKVLLKKGAYTPINYGEIELTQLVFRKELTEILLGLKSFPIHIVEHPSAKKAEKKAEPAQTDSYKSLHERKSRQ